ncbi:hypothetical protein C7H19_23675 [Aphanothece hegewaldii CCALA 016]|uniref:Uncharacterized protein n=1 Tax=Aphanothece hegewaldii CCALA 016 TaxID=2107694 RepID=A0A2T1LR58_9CHRO|nr:hypothetical protein [Aphanothece hegewaldii]PSF30584.1 hypothetical protein C7H19_23675 [Aphanothece hegewaldii CCALA 016]
MTLQIITTSGAKAVADGVLISQSDLAPYGLKPSDITDDSIGMFRLLRAVFKALGGADYSGVLGISRGSLGQTSPAFSVINVSCSFTFSFVVEATSKMGSLIPIPTTGINAGLGGLDLASIFPSISKVNANSNVSSAGLLIPTIDLQPMGCIPHASLNLASGHDNRQWFEAFLFYLASVIPVRDKQTASALVLKNTGSSAGENLPANAIAQVNPTTGLDSTKNYFSFNRNLSFTFQSVIAPDDTVDVRVVTT